MDVQPPEKALRLLQNCTRLLQKTFDQLALARHRGIDHNNKILDFLLLLRLKRFDQRHVAIELHSIIVKNIVKGIQVDLHFLLQHTELPQKLPIVIALPTLGRDLLLQASHIIRRFFGKCLDLRLHPVSDIIPSLLLRLRHVRVLL